MATAVSESEKAGAILARAADDPVWFCRHFLGAAPYDRQEQMMRLVATSRRVAISSANSMGKDWAAGRLLLWWVATHRPSKAVIVAPTYRQAYDVVWKEARAAYYAAAVPLGGQMYREPRWELGDDRWAMAFSTDEPMAYQGFHSWHLLVLISEAHAFAQDDIEAIKRLNPEKMVMTGNPLSSGGEFYEAFHANAGGWQTLSFSGFDSPNVRANGIVIPGLLTAEDIAERQREWGEENPLYIAGVMGEFPASLEDVLIPRNWVDRALATSLEPSEPTVVALDVARHGSDRSALARRDGPCCHICWSVQGYDTMALVGEVKAYLDDHPECGKRVVVDDVGVGGGVTDRLREMGYAVHAFNGGEAARDAKRWYNATAEAWGLMAGAFREGKITLRPNMALIGQLCSRRYSVQSDRTLRLESKDILRAKGGKSPDEADALSMCFAPGVGGGIQVWV